VQRLARALRGREEKVVRVGDFTGSARMWITGGRGPFCREGKKNQDIFQLELTRSGGKGRGRTGGDPGFSSSEQRALVHARKGTLSCGQESPEFDTEEKGGFNPDTVGYEVGRERTRVLQRGDTSRLVLGGAETGDRRVPCLPIPEEREQRVLRR